MAAYYNENDPYAAQWLRNLMAENHICSGFVDERSIADVQPGDLAFFTQCHFFAGVGVWSHALRCAGWPDDRPIWTGSCPCQPFSGAGKRKGFADERHLWPIWFDLIRECRPDVILGEQVASPDGYAWFDDVQADMEGLDHACGAVVTPAAGYGAPEERHRIYWMAHALSAGRTEGRAGTGDRQVAGLRAAGGLGDADGRNTCAEREQRGGQHGQQPENGCVADRLDNAARIGHEPNDVEPIAGRRECATGPVNGFWQAADWLFCRDGKWRPVEPGTFPLAHGTPNRVAKLRAAGNAIVAPQAAKFIETVMEYI